MTIVDHVRLIDALVPAVLAAGGCLLRHRAAGLHPDAKADGSPVTEADREAEAIVTAGLQKAAPDIPVIGEEAVAAGIIPAFADRAFVVDALDGTREFIRGGDDFTVNVALVVDGHPVFGLLLAPAIGRLFATLGSSHAAQARIDPARLDGAGPPDTPDFKRISTREPDPAALGALTSRSHNSPQTDAFLARFHVGQTIAVGSSLKFGLLAAGEADIYPRFGPTCAWDIAAGHAIVAAAGGTVTLQDGAPLLYLDRPRDFLNPPFVAWGRPSLVRALAG